MELVCPHCGFSREVEAARLPSRPVRATCPRCRERFPFDPAAPLPEPPVAEAAESAAGMEPDPFAGDGKGQPEEVARNGRPSPDGQGEPAPEGPPPPPERAVIPCPACGLTQLPTHRCAGCGAPFVARPVAAAGYAGFWIRVVAALVDGLLVGLLQFILTFLLSLAAIGSGSFQGGSGDGAVAVVTGLFGSVIGAAYYIVFTGHCGQTPGKMAVRVRVVRSDGSRIGYLRAALREIPAKFLSGLILGIGYLMVAFDERKQGLHDKIADTVVIKL